MATYITQNQEIIFKTRAQTTKLNTGTTTQSISDVKGITGFFNDDHDDPQVFDQCQNPYSNFVGIQECSNSILSENNFQLFQSQASIDIQQLQKMRQDDDQEQKSKDKMPEQVSIMECEKYVFKEKDLNQYMVKNVNMPKYFVKMFIRNLEKYKYIYKMDEEAYIRAKKIAEQLDEFAKQNKNNYLSLKHLELFFTEKDKQMNSFLNRKAMQCMIRNESRREILENSQIKHKLSYAVTTKAFGLRCFNQLLVSRVQSK